MVSPKFISPIFTFLLHLCCFCLYLFCSFVAFVAIISSSICHCIPSQLSYCQPVHSFHPTLSLLLSLLYTPEEDRQVETLCVSFLSVCKIVYKYALCFLCSTHYYIIVLHETLQYYMHSKVSRHQPHVQMKPYSTTIFQVHGWPHAL